MLYDNWRNIAGARPTATALWESATGRCWTFAELAAAAEADSVAVGDIVFAQGLATDFVIQVLRGWRSGAAVCPLDIEQAAPHLPLPLGREIAHLKTTSATTGNRRLVAFTAAQLAADAVNIVATMGLRSDWPNLAVISLAHSYGFSNLVLPLLLHGIPLVLVGAALPDAVQQAAAAHPGITLAAVPALWRMWHDANAIPPNVRLAISAGAPLPLSLEQAIFTRQGLKVHNFYGSSECGGIAYDHSAVPRQDGACAGAPLANVEVSAADDGCLEVRSRAVGQTYWPEPDAKLANGVFRTSDLGEIRNGQIYLRGRAGDQINVAGRKVAPEVIETVLATHPSVRACLVFGVPSSDIRRSETIVACVAADPGTTTDSLKALALARLPSWQVPRDWWLLQSLETNDRGKLSRAEWRRRYLERQDHAPRVV